MKSVTSPFIALSLLIVIAALSGLALYSVMYDHRMQAELDEKKADLAAFQKATEIKHRSSD
jgi:flagellar basal body-associated protein FliL